MLSFPNFITFLRNHPDLPARKSEPLHDFLFRNPSDREASIQHLATAIGVPTREAADIVAGLIAAQVIEAETIDCPNCGDLLAEFALDCPRCGSSLLHQWSFSLPGCMSSADQTLYKSFASNRAEAERFAELWLRQGYVYYLLIDLAESENLQEMDSGQYNQFMEDMRSRLKTYSLSQARIWLCLGEVGDCIKLAFLSADDAIAAIQGLSEILTTEDLSNKYPPLRQKEAPFPSFDGTLGKILLSNRKVIPEKLLCVTLNGALDFNDYELTRLYRFDQVIKTNKSIFEECKVSVWIQELVVQDLEWDDFPVTTIDAPSHGTTKKENFALLVFPGREGEPYEAIEKPDTYRVKIPR